MTGHVAYDCVWAVWRGRGDVQDVWNVLRMRILDVHSPVDLQERRHLGHLGRLGCCAPENSSGSTPQTPRLVTYSNVLGVPVDVLNVAANVLNVEARDRVRHVATQRNKQDHYYCLYISPRCRSTESHRSHAPTPRRILNVLNVLSAYGQSLPASPNLARLEATP